MQEQDDAATVESLAVADASTADVDLQHRELLDFARLLTERPAETADADVQRLRDVGWNDDQIAEAVYTVSLFAFFNRLADAFGLDGEDFRLNHPEATDAEPRE